MIAQKNYNNINYIEVINNSDYSKLEKELLFNNDLIDFLFNNFNNLITLNKEEFLKDIWNGKSKTKRVKKGYFDRTTDFNVINDKLIKIQYKLGILYYNFKNYKISTKDKIVSKNPISILKKINNIKDIHKLNSLSLLKDKKYILEHKNNFIEGSKKLKDNTKLEIINITIINSYLELLNFYDFYTKKQLSNHQFFDKYYINFNYKNEYNEIIKDYFFLCKSKYSTKTISNKFSYLKHLIDFLTINNIKFNELNRDNVELFLNYLNDKKLSNINYNLILGNTSSFIDFLVIMEELENNYLNPKFDNKPNEINKKYISEIPKFVINQIKENFNNIDKKYQIIIKLLYYTGLRSSDILNLTIDNLFIDGDNYLLILNIKKTLKREHQILINKSLFEELIYYYENVTNLENNPDKHIFMTKKYNKLIGRKVIAEIIHNINLINEDGSKYHLKLHMFRGHIATVLYNKNVDIKTIQTFLNHKNKETTENYIKLKSKDNNQILKENELHTKLFKKEKNENNLENNEKLENKECKDCKFYHEDEKYA